MKIIFLHLAMFWLGVSTLYGQHSCCTSGGVATISVGSGSESMLMPKNTLGIEMTNMSWFLKPQKMKEVDLNTIADVSFVNASTIGVHFGLLKNLSLSSILPYIVIRSDVYTEGADSSLSRTDGDIAGFGDMSFIAKYQIPLKNGNIPEIALISGIEMPTGSSEQQNGNVVASMGSKSWDPIFGIGLKKESKTEKFVFSLNSTYKISTLNTEHVDFGDYWNTMITGMYKFEPKESEKDSITTQKPEWFKTVSFGLSNNYLFRQLDNREYVPNTGYDRLFATVGFSVGINKRFRLNVNGEVPLAEKINGAQNKSFIRLRTSILITLNNK